jgi:putative ABC transport system permease protein
MFFNAKQTSINGSLALNQSQANIGIILSKLTSSSKNDSISLTIEGRTERFNVQGIVQTATQTDSEITVPLSTANQLTGENSVSFVEFALKDPSAAETTLNIIEEQLSTNEKIVKIQQIETFANGINSQTVSFLNLWSIAIYAVVAAASYVIASRIVSEAKYEIAVFQTVGAQRKATFQLVLVNTLATAFFGSVLGLAVGIAGAQIASTVIRWALGNLYLAPSLELGQALEILLIAIAAAVLGSLYPALKSGNNQALEVQL